MAEKNTHEHDWQPDGESWTETEHLPNCDYNENLNALAKPECLKNCKRTRFRRYTCHCGASKKVKLK